LLQKLTQKLHELHKRIKSAYINEDDIGKKYICLLLA